MSHRSSENHIYLLPLSARWGKASSSLQRARNASGATTLPEWRDALPVYVTCCSTRRAAAAALLGRQHAPERAAIPSQSPGGPCAVTPSRPPHLGSAGGPLQTSHLSGALLAARVRNKACATCRRAQDCADTREERRRTAWRRDHGSARRRPDDYEQQRTAPFIDQRRHSTAVRLHSRRDLRSCVRLRVPS